jgi:radical SAM superfamily enzyme YgiQ (UPF0313 family)
MYVSTYLKSLGHNVKVLNYNLWDYDLKEELKGQNVAGFTGFEEFKPYILRDEKICLETGIKTMVGGALATFNAIPEFNGLKYQGEVEQFGKYGLPDYEAFGIDEYHRLHNLKYMGVLTGRGCPYSCTFCSQTCKFKLRNIDNVFAEIDLYKEKYGIEMIVFNDNTFNINKTRFMKFCDGMKDRGLTWSAAVRCSPFDEDMARAAEESGCVYLVVGVESFNQEKLDRLDKKIKTWQITRTLDLLHKYGIDYHGNILVGFEDETLTDISMEINSIPKGYNLFPVMVQPFVGTAEGKKRGITKEQFDGLTKTFTQYIESKGKYCYPQLES